MHIKENIANIALMHMQTILICICIFFDFVKKINQKTLTGRGVSRVNYEVPRLFKLHEDARRCSKDF